MTLGVAKAYHGFIRVLHENEGCTASGSMGVVQVAPDEDAGAQQEGQGQQQHQDGPHCNLASIAREQICTARHSNVSIAYVTPLTHVTCTCSKMTATSVLSLLTGQHTQPAAGRSRGSMSMQSVAT